MSLVALIAKKKKNLQTVLKKLHALVKLRKLHMDTIDVTVRGAVCTAFMESQNHNALWSCLFSQMQYTRSMSEPFCPLNCK